ncbi:FUSC family protein [Kitasatospora sp. NBC_01302]|uniref:FUSC family protein n=1 Tax=Kitasatospora sp. NBC_01302 TaxID=2903575 RepID=UPI002E12834C|nr:FUSC family protein [Kitasatospora sp. NBC_01302]
MTGPLGWLLRQPEGPSALRSAVWVTVAGCTGFYVLTYGFDRPVMGLYAMFGALPLALFSHLPGSARDRTGPQLAALPAGLVLVTAGTLLAVSTWAAALGLFVVSFVVCFLGVGGPRPAGLAPALQLYYVLPCFPPYEPHTLGQRLAGLTIGILLTVLTDRLLWAGPRSAPYRVLLAEAVAALADYCEATVELLSGDASPAGHQVRAQAVDRTFTATGMSAVPQGERPTSVSVRDHGLLQTRAAARHIRYQLDDLAEDALELNPAAAHLLGRTAAGLRRAAQGLRAGVPEPADEDLHTALKAFHAERVGSLTGATPVRLRQDAVTRVAAESALVADEAARIALGTAPGVRRHRPDGPFGYAVLPWYTLWWRRLRLHLTPHSVLLQNALRTALALGGARLIVGLLDVPHGFWVLLATLSLMRTSAADTRAALVPALIGTAAGAVLATLLLLAVGQNTAFYAAATPVVLLVGFTVGTVLGPAWIQGAMTLLLVLLFTQILPPDVHLPAIRFLAVLGGGGIGALAGLLAWPRGARGQLRYTISDFTVQGARTARAVTARLCAGGGADGDPLRAGHQAMALAQAVYVQYRTERPRSAAPEPHWESAMMPGYQSLTGGELVLLGANGRCGPLPPEAVTHLTALADRTAAACLRAAAVLRGEAEQSEPVATHAYPAQTSPVLRCAVQQAAGTPPLDLLLIADTEAWLTAVARSARLGR